MDRGREKSSNECLKMQKKQSTTGPGVWNDFMLAVGPRSRGREGDLAYEKVDVKWASVMVPGDEVFSLIRPSFFRSGVLLDRAA